MSRVRIFDRFTLYVDGRPGRGEALAAPTPPVTSLPHVASREDVPSPPRFPT